jgi:hypothetical protein
MVVGAISGHVTLPPIKVPPKAKINADYYISHVLKSICEGSSQKSSIVTP